MSPLAFTATSFSCEPRVGSGWPTFEMAVAEDHPTLVDPDLLPPAHATLVSVVAIVPVVAVTSVLFRAGWLGFFALLLASVIPTAYGAFLSYSIAEFLAQPVVEDIADRMPDITKTGEPRRLRHAWINGIKELPVRYA